MFITNFIIQITILIIALVLIVNAYKKHSQQQKGGVIGAYNESPSAQIKRSFLGNIPLIIALVIMAIFAFLHFKQTSNPSQERIVTPGIIQ